MTGSRADTGWYRQKEKIGDPDNSKEEKKTGHGISKGNPDLRDVGGGRYALGSIGVSSDNRTTPSHERTRYVNLSRGGSRRKELSAGRE